MSKIKDMVEYLEETNPLRFDQSFGHRYYEYKIKKFITDCALGMMPFAKWNGLHTANGGYLQLKLDADRLFYHVYYNELAYLLLNNTQLETPSSTGYDFGKIELQNETQIIILNLQIGFI